MSFLDTQLLFINTAEYKSDETVIFRDHYLFCAGCDLQMNNIFDNTYECPSCERQYTHYETVANFGGRDDMQTKGTNGKIHKFRTRGVEYRLQQIQNNKIHLMMLNEKYQGSKIPVEILDEAAKRYSSLQISYYNLRKKKFVRRGNIKEQILACFVFRLLKKKGMARQRSEVAQIFGLESTGFSAGETQLQELENALNLDLVYDPSDEIIDLAKRYLKSLEESSGHKIYTPKNLQFVINLVIRAEVIKCGICCYSYSRVAGAVYMLTNECKKKFKNNIIESACDFCKKNTFERFHRVVIINNHYFEDIFDDFHKDTQENIKRPDTRRLPHMKKYLKKLVELYGDMIPEFQEMASYIENTPDLPDDYDPYIDSVLKKYNYPSIPKNVDN